MCMMSNCKYIVYQTGITPDEQDEFTSSILSTTNGEDIVIVGVANLSSVCIVFTGLKSVGGVAAGIR